MKATNRDYIKKIVELINSEFDKAKEASGYVERSFFESGELGKIIQGNAQIIFRMLRYPELSEKKWAQLYDHAIKESRHENQSGMSPSISLTSESAKRRNWLDEQRQKRIGWDSGEAIKTYRDRYFEYLSSIGRSKSYINETKRSSLEITKKLGDPESDHSFYVRGLVVGSVQSGKTANFNAVINSAIDVGYGLIIVLSGIMEDLRRQTQRRVEKEVEGKFENGAFIGVGAVSSFGDSLARHKDVRSICVPTSVDTDFRRTIMEADFSLINKNLLVCKKNTSVLKNLLLWLDNYLNENKDKIRVPLLIVDDEADNASLNNLGKEGRNYASMINGHIRALLGLFEKKTYLGYTATPFGNVLQDRHSAPDKHWIIKDGGREFTFERTASLFPKDFIELLFPPPNYIGAKHFFETVSEDVKTIDPLIAPLVTDHINSFPLRIDKDTEKPTNQIGKGTRSANKWDDFPLFLPKSLEEAVMCFVVSTAIRISRKQAMFESKLYQPHNTMLIHVSRFITWQSKTRDLVEKFVQGLEESLKNDNPQDGDKIYGDFEKIWNKYYAYIVSNIWTYLPDDYDDDFLIGKTFLDIKPLLIAAVQNIEVKAINSLPPKDALVYPEGSEKTYIAIGGNRLSRGFTLEGLTVNYFIRNTNFADTLLQMGRWFGYRPGYIDCCKLFTTADAMRKFNQTSLTIEDLEQKFIDMNRDSSNSPEKYALRVLTHPGVLKLTRDSILKNAEEVKFSYSDHLIQTTEFLIEDKRIKESWKAFCDHVSTLSSNFVVVKNPNGKIEYLKYETDNVEKLFEFFDLPCSYITDDMAGVKHFIRKCNENNKLINWTISIKVSGAGSSIPVELKNIFNIDGTANLSRRKGPRNEQVELFYTLRDKKIFKAGGKSRNIVSSGKDFQIRLEKPQVDEAEREFRVHKYNDLLAKYPDRPESELRLNAEITTVPEKVYRQKMSDKEGVLVIYLMDLKEVFSEADGLEDLRASVDTGIPLVGYAVGIPPVSGDIGANYMLSKFHVDEESDQDNDEYKDYAEVLNES